MRAIHVVTTNNHTDCWLINNDCFRRAVCHWRCSAVVTLNQFKRHYRHVSSACSPSVHASSPTRRSHLSASWHVVRLRVVVTRHRFTLRHRHAPSVQASSSSRVINSRIVVVTRHRFTLCHDHRHSSSVHVSSSSRVIGSRIVMIIVTRHQFTHRHRHASSVHASSSSRVIGSRIVIVTRHRLTHRHRHASSVHAL